MKSRSLGIAAVALFLPFAAVACGSDSDSSSNPPAEESGSQPSAGESGTRPTAEELATQLQEGFGVPDDNTAAMAAITCLSKGVYDSDLSDNVLRMAADGEEADMTAGDKAAFDKVVADVQTTCDAG